MNKTSYIATAKGHNYFGDYVNFFLIFDDLEEYSWVEEEGKTPFLFNSSEEAMMAVEECVFPIYEKIHRKTIQIQEVN